MTLYLGDNFSGLDPRLVKKDDAFVKEGDGFSEITILAVEQRASTDWKFESHVGVAPNVAMEDIWVTM